MAQVITFFSRQAIFNGTVNTETLYSDIFEIPEGAQLAVQFRVLMTSEEGAPATAIMEDCMDARLTPTSVWTEIGTAMAIAANPPPSFTSQTLSNLKRFIRAKVTGPLAAHYVVSLDGVLRNVS